MKFKIYHEISSLLREVYHIEIHAYEGHPPTYEVYGLDESRRNNPNDIWGDEWPDLWDVLGPLQDELVELYGPEDYWPCDCPKVKYFEKLKDDLNPVCAKTILGQPFLGGCSPPSKKPAMPEYQITREVRRRIRHLADSIKPGRNKVSSNFTDDGDDEDDWDLPC